MIYYYKNCVFIFNNGICVCTIIITNKKIADTCFKASLALSVSSLKNQEMKNKSFHAVIQSNNTVFAGFNHAKLCCSGDCFSFFFFKENWPQHFFTSW